MNWLPMNLGLKVALSHFLLLQGKKKASLALARNPKPKPTFLPNPDTPLEVIFSSLALEQSQNKLG